MSKDFYNKEHLEDTLKVLGYELKELEAWSVYNKDKGNDEIWELKEAFEKVKEAVKGNK